MESINNMTNIRSSSQELDGRRPTAPGMPPYEEGNWSQGHHKCMKLYGNKWDWTAARFKEELDDYNSRVHCNLANNEGFMTTLLDLYYQRRDREDRVERVSEARKKLSRELGPREFTLTYSPDWFADDATAQDAMRVAIDKLSRYYKDDIIEFHAIGEFTEAGRAHVHCYYELDGGAKITDKNFKRAWPFWNPAKKLGSGHQGGHHANVRSKSDFLGYIEKDLNDAWLNVHITNADDDKTSHGSRDSQELRSDGGEKDV